MARAMNIVRYKPKANKKSSVIEAHKKWEKQSLDGAISLKVVDCGDVCCGLIEWENEEKMQSAMPQLVEFLDTIRDDLDEVSPELGVTDPVSGKLVVDN